jgi:branched-chain amino acid aminotransferase
MVDKRAIGNGNPGLITRQLVKTYWTWHADPAYSLPIDYSL